MNTPSSWHLYYAPVQKIFLLRPSFQASLMLALPPTLSILKEKFISFNSLLWNTNVKVGVESWINIRLTLNGSRVMGKQKWLWLTLACRRSLEAITLARIIAWRAITLASISWSAVHPTFSPHHANSCRQLCSDTHPLSQEQVARSQLCSAWGLCSSESW